MSAVRTPSTPASAGSMGACKIHQAAKGIVISFASVGPNSVKEAAAARQCFEGCNSVSLAVAAGPELLIVGSTIPKTFIHQSSSLAGQAIRKGVVCHDVRVSNRPSCYYDVEEAHRRDQCSSLTAMPVAGAKGEILGAVCLGLQQNVNLSSKHLETLRLLALALGPLLQQFIADTQLYQDTSVFVDEGVAQCMMSGQPEPMDDSESCEADFLQYDLGTYEEFSEDVLHRSSCEWERPAGIEAEYDDLNDMRNCASLESTCSESFYQAPVFCASPQRSVQQAVAE
ncbi:g373 [Coccomyxa viridis]|uniref:G373 protein n=1 Tax=Coccomyxa viridis TaxID=1274662 RepID=A0ABP1FM65_9CHLO